MKRHKKPVPRVGTMARKEEDDHCCPGVVFLFLFWCLSTKTICCLSVFVKYSFFHWVIVVAHDGSYCTESISQAINLCVIRKQVSIDGAVLSPLPSPGGVFQPRVTNEDVNSNSSGDEN
jgi:hypothetical protein